MPVDVPCVNKGEIRIDDDGLLSEGTFAVLEQAYVNKNAEYTWLPGTNIFEHNVPPCLGYGNPQAGICQVYEKKTMPPRVAIVGPEGVLYQLFSSKVAIVDILNVGLSSDGRTSAAGDVCDRVDVWNHQCRFREMNVGIVDVHFAGTGIMPKRNLLCTVIARNNDLVLKSKQLKLLLEETNVNVGFSTSHVSSASWSPGRRIWRRMSSWRRPLKLRFSRPSFLCSSVARR